jgi:integrase
VAHGDGRVYQPKKNGKRLQTWYFEIFFGGRRKVGRGFRTRKEAEAALKAERKRKARGEYVPAEVEQLTVKTVLENYKKDLVGRGKKSLSSVKSRVQRLTDALGHRRAIDLRTPDIDGYRHDRLSAGLNRATIDREVEVLRAAFRLALKREQVTKLPYFEFFNLDNIRQGFYEPEQTEKIIGKLPEVLAEVVRFASLAGWRISEILSLEWSSVDLRAGVIRLVTTKNGRPRTLALTGELLRLIERRWKAREYRASSGPALSAFVFHRRCGRPISYSSYRKAFVQACKKAEVVGRSTHDFRRTVARDLRRLGIDESTCMSVTGHGTNAMFRRYAGIIDPSEQVEALARRDAFLLEERKRAEERGNLAQFPGLRADTV